MEFNVRKIDSVTILDLDGRLTLAGNTPRLHNLLEALLLENQRQFVLNMQNVRLIDCAGVGQIALSYRRVREKGGDLKLLNLDRRLHYILKVMRLLNVMKVFDDEREAISSFPLSATLLARTVPHTSGKRTADEAEFPNTLAACNHSSSPPIHRPQYTPFGDRP